MAERPSFECDMDDEEFLGYDSEIWMDNSKRKLLEGEKCTKFYYETEFDVFQTRGSVASVEGYITGLHNQVATLYQK